MKGTIKEHGFKLRQIADELDWSENYLYQQFTGRKELQAKKIMSAILRLVAKREERRRLLRVVAENVLQQARESDTPEERKDLWAGGLLVMAGIDEMAQIDMPSELPPDADGGASCR